MQLVNKPLALPGACKGCGAGDKTGYLDTGWQEEFYGAIYFCYDCVFDMASYFGAVSPEKYKSTLAELTELKQQLTKLEIEQRAQFKVMEGIDALVDLRFAGRIDSDPDPRVVADPPTEIAAAGSTSVAVGTDGPSKPGNDKNVGSLRSSKPASTVTV